MTTDLSNFDKQWSEAHFVSFLFYYYCTRLTILKIDNFKNVNFETFFHQNWNTISESIGAHCGPSKYLPMGLFFRPYHWGKSQRLWHLPFLNLPYLFNLLASKVAALVQQGLKMKKMCSKNRLSKSNINEPWTSTIR